MSAEDVHTPEEYSIPGPASKPFARNGEPRKRLVVLAHESQWPFEIMCPLYVFHCTNFVLNEWKSPELGYDLEVVSSHVGDTFSIPGLSLRTDRHFSSLDGDADTLMLQPLDLDLLQGRNDGLLQWVKHWSARVRRTAAICHATYILAEAGLVDSRSVTTHWAYEKDFEERYPEARLNINPIFIKDGPIYTTAGATSSMDLALALVEEDFGVEVARAVGQLLVVFLKRPGTQAQFSVQMQTRLPADSSIAHIQSYIFDNPHADLRVPSLANRAAMSPRNFSRAFAKDIGMPPGEFVEHVRIERASQMLVGDDASHTEIASRCGYKSADGLRQAFERRFGVSPRDYRKRFRSSEILDQ